MGRRKGMIRVLFALALSAGFLVACGGGEMGNNIKNKVETELDYEKSPFRHVNNGAIEDEKGLPYNVDAITGATITVEGPAMVTSIPLSIREFENQTEGIVRGAYEDASGGFLYEGMDLFYLLHDMVDGDNGIIMTDKAYKVVLKNANREDIACLTLEDIDAAHEAGRPVLLAYGKGSLDGKEAAPFVFDAKTEGEHSLGFVESLENDDGCIRLVYDNDTYGDGRYEHFVNVAYIYVCEEEAPGFKHSAASDASYGASELTDYIVGFRGTGLGYEIDLTLSQLEDLVTYNEDGSLPENGLGYRDYYSLANNAYWYVNEYEGLHFYNLLQYLGMKSYEEMGPKEARTTLIRFLADDGVAAQESFSVDTLSYPDAFGFYKKNAADNGDGQYVPSNSDLVKTGYPVLMAYGVNQYPYTVSKSDPGYLSGLSNSGGPVRIVFGKTQYNHANGSNQVQYLRNVIVGEDQLTNTHMEAADPACQTLAENEVDVKVLAENGQALAQESITVGAIEKLVYEAEAGKTSMVKDLYEMTSEDSAIYEGISLEYFFMDRLGLPGTNGMVTFFNGTEEVKVSLDRLFATGYNAQSGRAGMKSVLAYSKNGSPMVTKDGDPGYVDEITLHPFAQSDPDAYRVENSGGPLKLVIPASAPGAGDGMELDNVISIQVELIPDSYAHLEEPYQADGDWEIRFYGAGLDQEITYKLSELESRQTMVKTIDYSMLNQGKGSKEVRYRGIPVYELFAEIGLMSNAGEIHIYASDGSEETYSLAELKKEYDNFISADKGACMAMLAFGTGRLTDDIMEGIPLVETKDSPGFVEDMANNGGPIRLILPQTDAKEVNENRCMKNVVAIEVTANEVDSWSHDISDVYSEFLDYAFTLKVVNEAGEWSKEYTLGELESYKEVIARGKYTVLDLGECEGLDLWRFIKKAVGDIEGMDKPVSVIAYAEDDYKNDLLSLVYMDGLTKGIENEAGEVLPVLLCYGIGGYPLVDESSHPGYTGLVGNSDGPLRIVVEGSQGGSVKYCNKVVVTLPGKGKLPD